MHKPSTTRRNLFDVDVEAVERLVADANAGLVRRCEELSAALARMPATLETDDAVLRAEAYARQIKAVVAELRKAKSADRAPFAKANKTIDGFFDRLRKTLDKTLAAVDSALGAARSRAARHLDEPSSVRPIALGAGEHLVITAIEPPAPTGPSRAIVDGLPTIWKASFIDRGALDLEALRDLMTDADMDRLVARWLKENGPRPLRGVQWVEVVKT